MNYVIGDIHNDNRRFSQMLEKINFSEEDHLFLLGDLFDRNPYEPDPMGVYFNVLKLGNRCTVIRGNHDVWLAEYIIDYFNMPEKKRKRNGNDWRHIHIIPLLFFQSILQRSICSI